MHHASGNGRARTDEGTERSPMLCTSSYRAACNYSDVKHSSANDISCSSYGWLCSVPQATPCGGDCPSGQSAEVLRDTANRRRKKERETEEGRSRVQQVEGRAGGHGSGSTALCLESTTSVAAAVTGTAVGSARRPGCS